MGDRRSREDAGRGEAEHGEHGLRALGGRRAALRALDETDPGADVPALVGALESRAAAR